MVFSYSTSWTIPVQRWLDTFRQTCFRQTCVLYDIFTGRLCSALPRINQEIVLTGS